MALNEPVLSGPGAGRTVTYGGGSSAELKLAGEQSGGDWSVVEWRVRALNPDAPRPDTCLVDKHHSRKHGPGAYYGQK